MPVGPDDAGDVVPAKEERARAAGARGDRYSTFLSLSGDGIARFEMDPPLDVDQPEDQQVAQILRHGRVAECNEPFARFYDRKLTEMTGLAMGEFVPAEPARLHAIHQFIRSDYRMVHVEEEHLLGAGSSRWISASALGAIEKGRIHEFWVLLRPITEHKRAEFDRERRGRILEAVAFCAARLLQPRSWRAQADDVLARLGQAAEVARAWLAEKENSSDGALMRCQFAWGAPGVSSPIDDPRIADGVSLREAGLERLEAEMHSGRPVFTLVSKLSESERSLPRLMGSKSFAVVPIFANGQWWGCLAFGETRYEREWSAPEVEALKAAAAVLGAAIEREQADNALRESEQRFDMLSAASFEGIAIEEADVFVDCNEQFAHMLGRERSEIVSKRVLDIVTPENRALVAEQRAGGSDGPYTVLIRRPDGLRLPLEIRAKSMTHRGRTVRVAAIRDISARVEAEERQRRLETELRQAAEEWRQTFDALDLGIVLADAEGRIVRMSRAAAQLAAGVTFPDAAACTLEDLPDQEPWRALLDLHRQVGESRVSLTAEARDGSSGRSFYLLGSPWFRGAGEAPWRVVTFRDVTEFTAMQEQLRRARIMEAMGALVAGVAHEVRNPLFTISASVDALEVAIGTQSEFADYAVLLRSQVARLNQLTQDLLDYGRPSVLRRAPARLADVVRRARRACAALAQDRGVGVEEHLDGEMPLLDVDGPRLEQALENLLANAIQHSPRGSQVRVGGVIEVGGEGKVLRCTVEDDGPGLPPESVQHIFEPFFTRRKGGTGLGLSIVQRVVEAHGGSVTAENRAGGGARFVVLLPVGRAQAGSGRV